MSWTRLAATVSAALLAGWATCASAADDEYGRSGPYLGASGVYAFEDFSGNAAPSPTGSWGYSLNGGYRFNEYFALELDWDHLLGFDDSTGDADMWLIGLNAKVFPFHGIIQPFVLAGAGFAGVNDNSAPEDSENAGFRFGGGLEVYLARNWAITAQVDYILLIGSLSDYAAIPVSLGVEYRFY